jgi:hypothetical protein
VAAATIEEVSDTTNVPDATDVPYIFVAVIVIEFEPIDNPVITYEVGVPVPVPMFVEYVKTP